MLTIEKNVEGSSLTYVLSGRLDTETTPDFSDDVDALPKEITDITIDMQDLLYISSAGLRALLVAAKTANDRGGSFRCINVSQTIWEVFQMTGLLGPMGI